MDPVGDRVIAMMKSHGRDAPSFQVGGQLSLRALFPFAGALRAHESMQTFGICMRHRQLQGNASLLQG